MLISKWGKKLLQSGAALTNFYFKMRQTLFQSWPKFMSKWGSYLKAGETYFKVGHNIIARLIFSFLVSNVCENVFNGNLYL